MTAPVWPSDLPQNFLRDDFAGKSADNIIASQTAVGPAKVRRRSTAGVAQISGSMHMTPAQFATFAAFVSSDLVDRAKAFTFPAPITGTGTLVRMTNPYAYGFIGVDYKVSFQLEVLP